MYGIPHMFTTGLTYLTNNKNSAHADTASSTRLSETEVEFAPRTLRYVPLRRAIKREMVAELSSQTTVTKVKLTFKFLGVKIFRGI